MLLFKDFLPVLYMIYTYFNSCISGYGGMVMIELCKIRSFETW